MKKYILLILSIGVTSIASKHKPLNTKIWDKRYGVHQLKKEDQEALASGLYYLLTSKGQEQAVNSFVNEFYSSYFAPNCRGAFLKAYEYSALATHKEKEEKIQTWTKTLIPYYAQVLSMLDKKHLQISFGKDAGKKLPASFFELDRAINPQPQPVTHIFQVTMPGFSFQVSQTTIMG